MCIRDRQMKAADALERADPARREDGSEGVERGRVDARAVRTEQVERRAAFETADGLSVEAPVERSVVFGAAARAHGEAVHRRPLAVVGHAADDRGARTAMGAADERVLVAAVRWVEELA